MPDYIVQKPVNPDAVIKRSPRYGRTLEYMGEHYLAQEKYDGCAAVIKIWPVDVDENPEVATFSRTGEKVFSMARQELTLAGSFREVARDYGGLVINAEAWWPGEDQFSEISGAFRKKSEQRPMLTFIVNDILTMKEYEAGETSVPYITRLVRGGSVPAVPWVWDRAKTYAPGSYGDPQQLCNTVVGRGGYDGLILADPTAGYKIGSGVDGAKIKLKRKLSFDLRCTGIKEGTGKYLGMLGAMSFDFNGRTLWVNGGTDDFRKAVWADPSLVVGGIGEVEAMDFSSEGLLREPRFKGVRYDKLAPDA